EGIAGSADDALVDASAVEFLFELAEGDVVWLYAGGSGASLTGNRAGNNCFLFWLQSDLKCRFLRRNRYRVRREFEAGAAQNVIQASIRQDDMAICGVIRETFPFTQALGATHFKDVGEVCFVLQQQGDFHGL